MNVLPITPEKEIVAVPQYSSGEKYSDPYFSYVSPEHLQLPSETKDYAWIPYTKLEVKAPSATALAFTQNNYEILIRYLERAAIPASHELSKLLKVLQQAVYPASNGIRYVMLPEVLKGNFSTQAFEDKEAYEIAQQYEISPKMLANYQTYLRKFDELATALEGVGATLLKYNDEFSINYKPRYYLDKRGKSIDLKYLAPAFKPTGLVKNKLKNMRQWLEWIQGPEAAIRLVLDTQSVLNNSFKQVASVEEFKSCPVCYAFIALEDNRFLCGNWTNSGLQLDSKFAGVDMLILSEQRLQALLAKLLTKFTGNLKIRNLLYARYEAGELVSVRPYEKSKVGHENAAFTTTLLEKHGLEKILKSSNPQQQTSEPVPSHKAKLKI